MTVAWGFRSFSLAIAKSDVTTEAHRIALFVERELQSSTYFSITKVSRPFSLSEGYARDAICFVSRRDWSTHDAFDVVKGIPRWDRYFIYYATQESPQGQLVRQTIIPTQPDDLGSFPYPPMTNESTRANYLSNTPLTHDQNDIESTRILASKVQSFNIQLRPANQEVEIRLLLRQNGLMAHRGNGDREGGTFELKYLIQPQNTR